MTSCILVLQNTECICRELSLKSVRPNVILQAVVSLRARVCVCVFIVLVLVLHNKILKNVTSLMFSILRTCIRPFTRSKTFVLLKLNLVEIHNVYTHRSLFWLSLSVNGFSVTFVIRMQNFAMIASHIYVYWLLFGI